MRITNPYGMIPTQEIESPARPYTVTTGQIIRKGDPVILSSNLISIATTTSKKLVGVAASSVADLSGGAAAGEKINVYDDPEQKFEMRMHTTAPAITAEYQTFADLYGSSGTFEVGEHAAPLYSILSILRLCPETATAETNGRVIVQIKRHEFAYNKILDVAGITIQSYAGSPNTHLTPKEIGDICSDYTNGAVYVATGVTNSSWTAIAPAAWSTYAGNPNTNVTATAVGQICTDTTNGQLYMSFAADGTHWYPLVVQRQGASVSPINMFANAGNPNTAVTAITIGDICVDVTNGDIYIAGATGTATWYPLVLQKQAASVTPTRHYAYAGTPAGNVTASRIGDMCVDVTNGRVYVANATGTGGWVQLTKQDGATGAALTQSLAPIGAVDTAITSASTNLSACTKPVTPLDPTNASGTVTLVVDTGGTAGQSKKFLIISTAAVHNVAITATQGYFGNQTFTSAKDAGRMFELLSDGTKWSINIGSQPA